MFFVIKTGQESKWRVQDMFASTGLGSSIKDIIRTPKGIFWLRLFYQVRLNHSWIIAQNGHKLSVYISLRLRNWIKKWLKFLTASNIWNEGNSPYKLKNTKKIFKAFCSQSVGKNRCTMGKLRIFWTLRNFINSSLNMNECLICMVLCYHLSYR